MPADKQDRALASIDFLRSGGDHHGLSRLTLTAVVGLLQSLIDATPARVGQTYLRRLCDNLHDHSTIPVTGAPFHCTRVTLDKESWLDLDWWHAVLCSNIHHKATVTDTGTLGVLWGDGSGTGAGGTQQLMDGRAFRTVSTCGNVDGGLDGMCGS